jgi:hypothetical protein
MRSCDVSSPRSRCILNTRLRFYKNIAGATVPQTSHERPVEFSNTPLQETLKKKATKILTLQAAEPEFKS